MSSSVKFGVAVERGSEQRCGEEWGGVGVHAGAQQGEMRGGKREAYGVGVAPKRVKTGGVPRCGRR